MILYYPVADASETMIETNDYIGMGYYFRTSAKTIDGNYYECETDFRLFNYNYILYINEACTASVNKILKAVGYSGVIDDTSGVVMLFKKPKINKVVMDETR